MADGAMQPAAFHILLALVDGEAHGYALMGAVEELSGGAVTVGPGTLYTTIKRLLTDGLIEEVEERPDPSLDDRRRRYYQLSAAGHVAVGAESARLARLVSQARRRGILPRLSPEGLA